MPDFSLESTHRFWAEYADPNVYRVIVFMETVENWAVDYDSSVDEALRKLGDTLEDINSKDLGNQEAFIEVATHIRSSRNLRLLQTLDSAQPGAASKLLIYAEENSHAPDDSAAIFLKRNIVFERLRLLSRVFSKQRLELVQRGVSGDDS